MKATFFLIGRNAESLPSIVKRQVAEGHTVGHHSYSHPAVTLRQLSENAAQEEILERLRRRRQGRLWHGRSGAAKVPFFRFPGFADTPQLVDWLSTQNIAVFGADFWASDWLDMTPEKELALILGAPRKREDAGVLLLHDTRHQTAAMLPLFLREMKQRGFKIVALVPGSQPNATRAAPEGWTSETDKIIADVFAKSHHHARAHSPAKNGAMGETKASDAMPPTSEPKGPPSPAQ